MINEDAALFIVYNYLFFIGGGMTGYGFTYPNAQLLGIIGLSLFLVPIAIELIRSYF